MGISRAYQFELEPQASQTSRQCLVQVRDLIAGWVREVEGLAGNRWPLPFNGSSVPARPGHEVTTDQQECATHALATLDWEFADQRDPFQVWRLSCTLACDADRVQVALVSAYGARTPGLHQVRARFDTTHPLAALKSRLLAPILERWPCRVGPERIVASGIDVPASGVEGFVNELLLAPDRALPILVISPKDRVPELASAPGLDSFQGRLLFFARVAVLDREAMARLTELLGAERSCESGVRIYWPGFRRDSLPGPHVFRTFEQIEATLGGRTLQEEFYQLFATSSGDCFQEGALIRAARSALARARVASRQEEQTVARRLADAQVELTQARQARERFRQERDSAQREAGTLQKKLDELRGEVAALREVTDGPSGEGEQGLGEFAGELERAWDENQRLRAEADLARQRLGEMEAALRNARDDLARLWKAPAGTDAAEDAAAPSAAPADGAPVTVVEALRCAATELADVLTIWDDAVRSAEESRFASPDQVLRALHAIAEVGRGYFAAQTGGPPLGPVDQAFRARIPFKYTGFESQTTMGMYGADRVFHHGPMSRQMQRHLTLGGGQTNNCLQIYFDFDDEARRVVIGYCGRHLRFYRQRT
jgi:hypothetical protein